MPEKHSTIRDGHRLVWHTQRLWREAASLTPFEIEVEKIRELDADCWFQDGPPTLRAVAAHFKRMQKADLDYPIILNDDGSLMDGGHRLCKALAEGRSTILAVQFPTMPEPDRVEPIDS